MRKNVLKAPVDVLTGQQTLSVLSSWIVEKAKMKLVVTAYSEFFVKAQTDKEFMKVMQTADLVTPDGVSVLAAVKYLDRVNNMGVVGKLFQGVKVGGEIVTGKVGRR